MTKKILTLWFLFSFPALAQLTNESEVGIASANGNTSTQSFSLKQLNDYKWSKNILSYKGRFLNASANGEETARYLLSGLKYERELTKHFGIFGGETLEKDRFANIDQRLLSDLGGRYRFIETDVSKFFLETGYRYMHEDRIDGTTAFNSMGRIYSEWEEKWNVNFTTRYWAEYLPNFSDPNDWLFNSEVSLIATLNSIFSLKSSFLLRYDHLPAPGVHFKTDTLFNTSLVAKF